MQSSKSNPAKKTLKKDKLFIFDTTLRDGEQSPGASMTVEEKLRIARALEKLGVDVIEAGFAIASEGDFQAVQLIAQTIKNSSVCSLSRARDKDIEYAANALSGAERPRIHTFIATSPLHMQYKLQLSSKEVLSHAIAAVRKARQYTDDVEFSCEDACRSEFDFLCKIIEATITAGATTINIPDTVGYSEPEEYGNLMQSLIETIPNSDKAVFSVHCHNDLGLAVANSLAAVRHGARQVECTINGLGERAGNASLEELVMAVKTRSDLFPVYTDITTQQLVPISRLVSGVTGFPVQPNKAIVGANAFAHEAGIHQDGVIKHRSTYEIMSAEEVGWQSNSLVLGKHSGRNAFRIRIEEISGPIEQDDVFEDLFKRFKRLADLKHKIYDEDLQALVGEVSTTVDEQAVTSNKYSLNTLSFFATNDGVISAEINIEVDNKQLQSKANGVGVVDASFNAIEKVVKSNAELLLYSVQAISGGTNAQGEVSVRLKRNGYAVNGVGTDPDIVVASAKAYISALNRLNDKDRSAQTHKNNISGI